jgi:hypothetical protein
LILSSIAVAALISAIATGPAHAVESSQEVSSALSGLNNRELSLYGSDSPKTIQIDPETGEVLSVTAGQPLQTRAVKSNCSGDVACWNGRPPAASYGFSGSGASGAWAHRSSFQTKKYTAVVCWTVNGGIGPVNCTPEEERAGKNSTLEWGYPVKGTKVSLRR